MRILAALVLCLTMTTAARAQHGVRGRIAELLSFGSCGAPLCLDNSVNATNGHGLHFIPDIIARNGAIVDFLADAIAANASNLPLAASGSSAGSRCAPPRRSAPSSANVRRRWAAAASSWAPT
jgi:hypothetical protein